MEWWWRIRGVHEGRLSEFEVLMLEEDESQFTEEEVAWHHQQYARRLKALPAGDGESEAVHHRPLTWASLRFALHELRIEPAGHRFEHVYAQGHGWAETTPDADESAPSSAEEEKEGRHAAAARRPTIRAAKEDPYGVLGLGQRRWRASDREIRDAYRRMALVHHPDKRGGHSSADDEAFKAVSKAWELLNEPKARRVYDSTDELFDDGVPSSADADSGDFFAVFAPVFARNAKWATPSAHSAENSPVPQLGDADTPIEQVQRFYEYWNAFPSWRSQGSTSDDDPSAAESREERRWLERRAGRGAKKSTKSEASRIRKLVEMAQTRDPRMRAYHAALDEERKRLRYGHKAEERRKRAEAEQKEREEAEKKAREAAQAEQEAKKRLAEAKAALSAARKAVFVAYSAHCPGDEVGLVDVRSLSQKLDQEALEKLGQSLRQANGSEEARSLIHQHLQAVQTPTVSATTKVAQSSPLKTSAWSPEEIALLQRLSLKYPVGTRDRWARMADGMDGRKAEEVMEMVKKLKDSDASAASTELSDFERFRKTQATLQKREIVAEPSARGVDAETEAADPGAASWSLDEQRILEDGLRKYPKSLGAERWGRIAAMLPGRSEQEVLARFRFLAQKVRAEEMKAAPVPPAAEPPKPFWSVEEQQRLEEGLRMFPKDLGPERWDRIADRVASKNRADCIARFKELAALVRSKQQK